MAESTPSTSALTNDSLTAALHELATQVKRLADSRTGVGAAAAPTPANARPSRSAVEVPEGNRAVFEALREWRRSEAKKAGVAPYVVAHDSALLAIAQTKPTDTKALAEVFGFKRTERYGQGILQVLQAA